MSSSLAYSFGGGGTDRFDKEINLKPLFKKKTYVDPFKRLSWPKRGSKSRTNSVDTPTTNEAITSPRNTTLSNEMTDSQPSNMRPQPSHNADTQLEISYHSLDSSSPVSQLSAILSLSNTIFNAQPDSTKYSSLSTWQTHLTSSSSSIVFFATIPCPDNNADVQPVGFIYAFPRTLAEYSDSVAERLNREETREVLHIWLCGILEKYRGKGVFEELMLLVKRWGRRERCGEAECEYAAEEVWKDV